MPLTDADVGITEVLGTHRPFRAVLKQIIDDFVVNEVLLSGKVARLERLASFPSPHKDSNNVQHSPLEKSNSTEENPLQSEIHRQDDREHNAAASDGCNGDANEEDAGKVDAREGDDTENYTPKEHNAKKDAKENASKEDIFKQDARTDGSSKQGTSGPINYVAVDELFPNEPAGSVADSIRYAAESDAIELVLPACADKSRRKKVHEWIRENLSAYVTDTVEKDGAQAVRLRKRTACRPWKRRRTTRGGRGKEEHRGSSDARNDDTFDPRERHTRRKMRAEKSGVGPYVGRNTYVSFVLWKRNMDTMEALNSLSKILRIPISAFTFAGTKDKRAVTTQQIQVRGVAEQRLAYANRQIARRDRGVRSMAVGNFEVLPEGVSRGLGLGDLKGNRFTLALRDLELKNKEDEENIETAVESLRLRGFVNYFGLQRFGSGVSGTHETGFAFLRGDFEEVCRRILLPLDIRDDAGGPNRIRLQRRLPIDALRKFEKKEITAKELLVDLPKWMHIERTIAESLAHDEEQGFNAYNYKNAFEKLPRNLRRMYGHAVQSYLWNIMATHRIRMSRSEDEPLTMHALAGDLIVVDESNIANLNYQTTVRTVTEEEEEQKCISIFRVVIPVLGSDVGIPDIDYGYAARLVLKEHKVDLEGRMGSEYGMKGTYRFLLAKPRDVDMRIVSYEEDKKALIPLDHTQAPSGPDQQNSAHTAYGDQNIKGGEENSSAPDAVGMNVMIKQKQQNPEAFSAAAMPDSSQSGSKLKSEAPLTDAEPSGANDVMGADKKKALVISFTLGCAEYATMLVRELTRKDTAVVNQKAMQSAAMPSEAEREA